MKHLPPWASPYFEWDPTTETYVQRRRSELDLTVITFGVVGFVAALIVLPTLFDVTTYLLERLAERRRDRLP